MTTKHTLTGNVSAFRGAMVYVSTNLDGPLIDLDATPDEVSIADRLRVPVVNGAFSVSLIATNSTGTNVSGGTLRYRVTIEHKVNGDRRTWSTPYFTFTANADVFSKATEEYLPPTYAGETLTEMRSLLAAAKVDLDSWPTYVYGNSYGVLNAGWFTVGNHYAQQATEQLSGGAVTSYAVGGRRILDVCGTLINGTAFPGTNGILAAGKWVSTTARNGLVVLESIVNDVAHYPTMVTPVPAAITTANTRYLDGVKNMYRTALALMSSESRIEQSAATFTGTWETQSTVSGSNSGGTVGYTGTVGAAATYTVTPAQTGPLAGKVYLLTYALDPSVGNAVASINVSVDGGTAVPFAVTPWEQYVGHDSASTYQIPVTIPVTVPVDGAAHTVRMTHAGTAGHFMYADALIIPSANPNPIAVMGAEHPLTGFTAPGLAAYNANRPKVQDVVKAVTAEFGNAFYVPSTMTTGGLYSGDGLHPNDRGMTQRKGDLATAVQVIKPRLDSRVQALRPNGDFAII